MCIRERGLTLIEIIVFIVVVGIALTAILLVMNGSAARSSDPLVRKQALAIAESLLEEVQSMPFTHCDADDAHVTSAEQATVDAADPAQCATLADAIGPEAGEARDAASTPFDHVSDYDGFDSRTSMIWGVRDIARIHEVPVGYAATVSVQNAVLGNGSFTIPSAAALRITVRVTGPGDQSVRLQGYRTRHAPRTP